MRIAIFCETYLPFLNGVVTHIKLLKEGLESQGHTVMIVTGDPDIHHHYLDEDNVLHCPGLRADYFYGYGLAAPKSTTRMDFIRRFRPDICHVHQEFGVGLFGIEAARELDKPLIYTIHTMYDDYIYYVAPKPFVSGMRSVSHRYFGYFAKNATALIGPSKKSQDYAKKIGSDKTVHIIPNPVELDAFYPNALSEDEQFALRTKLGISPDDFLCVFVGRIGREKSLHVLLDFWKEGILPEDQMHLLIIGEGPVLEDLKKQSEELDLQNEVTFAGKVLHDQLLPYYAISDVYITASLSDTYSISMLEGNAAGLPTIQIYDEENKDQVIDGKNGYTFKDAASMATVLRTVRDLSPEDKLALQSGVLADIQKFGCDAFAEKVIVVYEAAIEDYTPAIKSTTRTPTRFHWKKESTL